MIFSDRERWTDSRIMTIECWSTIVGEMMIAGCWELFFPVFRGVSIRRQRLFNIIVWLLIVQFLFVSIYPSTFLDFCLTITKRATSRPQSEPQHQPGQHNFISNSTVSKLLKVLLRHIVILNNLYNAIARGALPLPVYFSGKVSGGHHRKLDKPMVGINPSGLHFQVRVTHHEATLGNHKVFVGWLSQD